jgi:hypothetical protein
MPAALQDRRAAKRFPEDAISAARFRRRLSRVRPIKVSSREALGCADIKGDVNGGSLRNEAHRVFSFNVNFRQLFDGSACFAKC